MPQTRFEIEWCSHIPRDKDCPEESDIDHAVREIEYTQTLPAAIKRAKQLLPRDQFGSVLVTRQRVAVREDYPHTKYWENDADLYVDDATATFSENDLRRIDND